MIGTAMSIGLGVALTSMNPASAQGHVHDRRSSRREHRGGLRAPANARCELGTMSPGAGHPLTAFSDARGVVRYFVTMHGNARAGTLATLECRNAKAHTLVGLTLVPGPLAPPVVRPARRTTIGDFATSARFGVLPGTPTGFAVTTAAQCSSHTASPAVGWW